MRLSSLNLDSAFLVDSSGAWDLTHSGLRTNFFPYFFTLLLSSIPCSFKFLTHPAVPPVVSYTLQFSTLFTSQLSSTIYSSSHLYCLHLSKMSWELSRHLLIVQSSSCVCLCVCVFQCAAPPRCTRWHPPLLFARCLPCLCWWPTTESSHRPCWYHPVDLPSLIMVVGHRVEPPSSKCSHHHLNIYFLTAIRLYTFPHLSASVSTYLSIYPSVDLSNHLSNCT